MTVTTGRWVGVATRLYRDAEAMEVKPRWWLTDFDTDSWYPPFSRGWWGITISAFRAPIFRLLIGLGLWEVAEGMRHTSGHWTLRKPSWKYLRRAFDSIGYWVQMLGEG